MKINLVKFFKGLLILIIYIIIAIPCFALSVIFTPIYELVTLKWQRGLNKLGLYMSNISIVISKLINVACCSSLNFLFIKKGDNYFGDPDDDLLYIFAINKLKGNLSIVGRIITFFIMLISRSVLENALNDKYMHDQDAVL